ncbi:MAG: hypothetical protein JRN62_03875 [Nitrososphaerota archaeon]|nr:hypothetical protein [Nitrososphaerota archaeon]MDG6948741.1 hypothetical protein [Nitrososphaerota archaeon]
MLDIISKVLTPYSGLSEAVGVLRAIEEDGMAYCDSAVEWAESKLREADVSAEMSSAALSWMANLN